MCEVFGRRVGGDGVLQTYLRELGKLPVPNPYLLSGGEIDDLLGLFESACGRQTRAIVEELRALDPQAFDRWAMRWLFGPADAEDALAVVERALRDPAVERQVKAASGCATGARSACRRAFDPLPVAAMLLAEVGLPPNLATVLALPDDQLGAFVVIVPDRTPGSVVTIEASLFDSDSVIVDGAPIDTPGPSHGWPGRVLLQCDVTLSGVSSGASADATEVSQTLTSWREDLGSWRRRIDDNLSNLFPGAQRAGWRDSVRREIAHQAQVDSQLLG